MILRINTVNYTIDPKTPLIKELIKKNNGEEFSRKWLNNAYKERNLLLARMNKLLSDPTKKPTEPLLEVDPTKPEWSSEELRHIKKYVEDLERSRKPFELLFGRKFPELDKFLKEIRTEFSTPEEKEEYEAQRKEYEAQKEAFISKKIKMKARFAKNKTQTFDDIELKFKILKRIPGELVQGKIKLHGISPATMAAYAKDGKHMYYNSKYIFDANNLKP